MKYLNTALIILMMLIACFMIGVLGAHFLGGFGAIASIIVALTCVNAGSEVLQAYWSRNQ